MKVPKGMVFFNMSKGAMNFTFHATRPLHQTVTDLMLSAGFVMKYGLGRQIFAAGFNLTDGMSFGGDRTSTEQPVMRRAVEQPLARLQEKSPRTQEKQPVFLSSSGYPKRPTREGRIGCHP